MADPTAPQDNINPQRSSAPTPQSPHFEAEANKINPLIQPGQFVTTPEEETGVFKQAPTPQPQTTPVTQAPAGTNFAQATQPNPTAQTKSESQQQFENQPSPTPYVAPTASGQPPASAPSTIAKLRVFLIIFGFLLLVGLIASVAYLFVFKKSAGRQSAKTSADGQVVELPSPPPARRTGGFSELPQATEEGEQATPSAQ